MTASGGEWRGRNKGTIYRGVRRAKRQQFEVMQHFRAASRSHYRLEETRGGTQESCCSCGEGWQGLRLQQRRTHSQPLVTQQGENQGNEFSFLPFCCPPRWYECFPWTTPELKPEGKGACSCCPSRPESQDTEQSGAERTGVLEGSAKT